MAYRPPLFRGGKAGRKAVRQVKSRNGNVGGAIGGQAKRLPKRGPISRPAPARNYQRNSPSIRTARSRSYNPAPRQTRSAAAGRRVERQTAQTNRKQTRATARAYDKRQERAKSNSIGKAVEREYKKAKRDYDRTHAVGQALAPILARRNLRLADSLQPRPEAASFNPIMHPGEALKTLNKGVKPVKAPALAALEQVNRLGYASSNAVYQGSKAKAMGLSSGDQSAAFVKGAIKGAKLEEKHSGADTLRDVYGVKNKKAQAIGGFAFDVATDPTTYVTGGAGSVAEHAAAKAGTKAIARREAERASGKLAERAVKPTASGAKAAAKAQKKALREGARQAPRKDVVRATSSQQASQVASQARKQADERVAARRVFQRDTQAAKRAGRKAAARAPEGRGIQVGLGNSRRFRTTGKTSARVLRSLNPRVAPANVRAGARNLGSELSPWVKPAGVSQAEFDTIKGAERQARATTNRGAYRAMQAARALKRALPSDQYARVVDHIERGTVHELKPHTAISEKRRALIAKRAKAGEPVPQPHGDQKLYEAAREIEKHLKRVRRTELKAGVETPQSHLVRYFPHERKDIFEGEPDAAHLEDVGPAKSGGGKFTNKRGDPRTIKTINADKATKREFSTEVPAVLADRLTDSARKVSAARLGNAVAQAGRRLEPGAQWDRRTEGVFLVRKGKAPKELTGDELAEAKAKAATARVRRPPTKRGSGRDVLKWIDEVERAPKGADTGSDRYVIANRKFVEQRVGRIQGTGDRSQLGKVIDRGTGSFKRVATFTPGFHARNLIGDTQNAFLAQSAAGVAKNSRQAAAGLRHLGRDEKAAAEVGGKTKATRTLVVKDKYGRKTDVPVSRLVKEAESHGVIRSGYVARELEDLMKDTTGRVTKVRNRRQGRVSRAMASREDLMRMTTYLGGRRNGMTAREAADHAAKHHFDYGDLSAVEKTTLRRLFPFYTFSSRNLPLQTKSLVTKPGKYATIEKARQNAASAAGLPQDWDAKDLKEYQQRQAPIPIRIGGKVQFLSSALPLTDLNQLSFLKKNPSFSDLTGEQRDKIVQLLNPIARAPAELTANYNSFFKGPIESDTSPLVAAPAVIGKLPPKLREELGARQFIDKKSGKKVWGWPGKTAYKASTLTPGIGNFLQQIDNPVANQRGAGTKAKILSFTAGIKADPAEPEAVMIEKLFDQKDKLEKHRAILSQQGIGSSRSGKRETPEYKRVAARLKIVDAGITAASKSRGDKKPLLSRAKSKSKGKSPYSGISGGGSGGKKNPYSGISSSPGGASNPYSGL